MSSSDDYHRHRLRTATKYFKVSVKPFQRLGGARGGSPERNPWQGSGQRPEKKRKNQNPEKAYRIKEEKRLKRVLRFEEWQSTSGTDAALVPFT